MPGAYPITAQRNLRACLYLYAVPGATVLTVALALATGMRLHALTPEQW